MTPEQMQQYYMQMAQAGAQYEQQMQGQTQNQSAGEMHQTVRSFLEDLRTAVSEGNVETLDEMYLKDYSKLSDQIAKMKLGSSNKWPSIDEAKTFLGDDFNLLLLYRELYFRHVYAKCDKQITGLERIQSWETYQSLFEKIKTKTLPLPLSWTHDMLDEFLYQYQQFMQFRAKAIASKGKSKPQYQTAEQDLNLVRENAHVWDPEEVFRMLQELVVFSDIDTKLSAIKASSPKQGEDRDLSGIAGAKRDAPKQDMETQVLYTGYFALVQQLRYNVMLGDYSSALDIVPRLDMGYKHALFYRSPAAHCGLVYHLGFALMMVRRYSDAMRVWNKFLYFVGKIGRFQQLYALYDTPEMKRLQEKMYLMLGVCQILAPDAYYTKIEKPVLESAMDKQITVASKDKNDKNNTAKILTIRGLQDSNFGPTFLKDVDEFFRVAAPKFVTVVPIPKDLNAL